LNNRIPPMTPDGQAKLKMNIPDPFSATSNDPWKTCDSFGMPRIVNNEIGEIGFATMPTTASSSSKTTRNSGAKSAWTDARSPRISAIRAGPRRCILATQSAIGRENNTLVVDTVGMDDKTWADRRGYPHSIDAHVIERYTRLDHNHLHLEETVDDPAYYTEPFVIAKADYRWIAG
jgi:hypothetical protein